MNQLQSKYTDGYIPHTIKMYHCNNDAKNTWERKQYSANLPLFSLSFLWCIFFLGGGERMCNIHEFRGRRKAVLHYKSWKRKKPLENQIIWVGIWNRTAFVLSLKKVVVTFPFPQMASRLQAAKKKRREVWQIMAIKFATMNCFNMIMSAHTVGSFVCAICSNAERRQLFLHSLYTSRSCLTNGTYCIVKFFRLFVNTSN